MKWDRHIALLNRLFCLFSDNVICVQNWGPYLEDPRFDDEVELRNQIGVIWLTSLLDSLDSQQRDELTRIREQAAALQLNHVLYACNQAEVFLRAIGDLMSLFSRDEQLFLADYRDQLVHSWVARRHQAQFRLRYFDGEKIVRIDLTQDEHRAITRPFYNPPTGFIDGVFALISRAFDTGLPYWRIVRELIADRCYERIYDALRKGDVFRVPSLETPVAN